LLGLGLHAFIVAADAVAWIGEPDGAVGGDNSIVRRIQFLAIIAVCDDRDRAVAINGIAVERPFGRTVIRSLQKPLSWSPPSRQLPWSPKMRVCSLSPP